MLLGVHVAERLCRSKRLDAPSGGGISSLDLWEQAEGTSGWRRWSFSITQGGWVDDAFVEEAKFTMSLELWWQEFHAMFGTLVGALCPSLANW